MKRGIGSIESRDGKGGISGDRAARRPPVLFLYRVEGLGTFFPRVEKNGSHAKV